MERLLEVDPADEGAHQALMGVHAISGDGAAAHQQFAALLGALRDTLDVEPSADSHRSVRVGGARAPGAELVRRTGRGEPL